MTNIPALDAPRPSSEATPSTVHYKQALPLFASVALSSLGAFVGLALVLNATRFGSMGRYQFASRSDGNIVRMDTTTGEMSLCYGFSLVRPKCLPWGHDDRPFKTIPQPAQASQPVGGE